MNAYIFFEIDTRLAGLYTYIEKNKHISLSRGKFQQRPPQREASLTAVEANGRADAAEERRDLRWQGGASHRGRGPWLGAHTCTLAAAAGSCRWGSGSSASAPSSA